LFIYYKSVSPQRFLFTQGLDIIDGAVSNCFRLRQARREGGVERDKLPRAPRRLGTPLLARNIKYARLYHFEKTNSKIFSPEGTRENVWGPARMFPRAPLWLSTGLDLEINLSFKTHIKFCAIWLLF